MESSGKAVFGSVVLRGPIREALVIGHYEGDDEAALNAAIAEMDATLEHRQIVFTRPE